MSITYLPQSVSIVRFEFVDGGHISVTAGKQAARHINDASIRVRMSYISISTILYYTILYWDFCACVSVCTPHFKYNRKPIYFVQVKCLREKKFALWFSTKNLRRGAWLTLTKLRTRCRKTNGCCCRQTGPDSQTAKHPCIRNDNSYGFDGEMAQKKKNPRRSARQQEPETAPRSRQPACEWQCAS